MRWQGTVSKTDSRYTEIQRQSRYEGKGKLGTGVRGPRGGAG